MSLSTPIPPKQFSYGILTSKSFDDPDLLFSLFSGHFDSVAHIYTNAATDPDADLVSRFCRQNGIPYTVFPIIGHRNQPWAISRIVENSDAVYIIADEESQSAALAVKECERKGAKDSAFKWKLIPFEPAVRWKMRVFRAKEILACMSKEELKDSLWAKSVGKALES